jgi:hypothetical protein
MTTSGRPGAGSPFATHPDRADGGDPETFAAATAAYTALRAASGRSEALAELPDLAGNLAVGTGAATWLALTAGRDLASQRRD